MAECLRILLVDDDQDARNLGVVALRDMGDFEVDVASSGSEAVTKALAGAYHLILMDFNMPRMDGVQTTQLLRDLDVHTPVIFVTSNISPANIAQYRAAGALTIISKPYNPSTLAHQVGTIWTAKVRMQELAEVL